MQRSTTMMVTTLTLLSLALNGCGAEDAATATIEQAMRCTDCPDPGPPTPKPGGPVSYQVPQPWARAIQPGKPLIIKALIEGSFGPQLDYELRERTTWQSTGQVLSVVPTSGFRFSLETLRGPTTKTLCRLDIDFRDIVYYTPDGFASHVYPGQHDTGVYDCTSLSHDDESENNNGGRSVYFPALDVEIWAKREDRLRIRFPDRYQPGVVPAASEYWQIELDTDETR